MLIKLVFLAQLLVFLVAVANSAQAKTIRFSGFDWNVRSAGRGGPGPNEWDESNVWLDDRGALHLKIAPRDGTWYCAEVSTTTRLGFGRYQFLVEGPVDKLDRNIVLGLFNYPPRDVGRGGTHELDIEYAKWGLPDAPIGNYTVWPVERELKNTFSTFIPDFQGNLSTQRFTWSPGRIFFQSLRGHRDDDGEQVASWLFAPGDAAQRLSTQPMPVHINLWLFRGQPPTDGNPVEIIIRAFIFTPEAAEEPKTPPAPGPK